MFNNVCKTINNTKKGIENQVCELTIGQEFTTLDYESITMRLSQMIAGCGNRVPVLSGKALTSDIIYHMDLISYKQDSLVRA